MASGIDQQRLSLLLAVLEKRAGLNLMGDDVFVNIAGGMTIDEPAADLGVLAAIASSVRNRVSIFDPGDVGEVGLVSEVRGITQAALRVREAAQMGFKRCIMPEANIDPADRQLAKDCELVGVRTVGEALDERLGSGTRDAHDIVTSMAWFVFARVLFVGIVAYAAAILRPLAFGIPVNIALPGSPW